MLILHRSLYSNATYGLLIHENKPLCNTLELPWLNNARNISCIPAGAYTLTKYISPTHKHCFYISDVPNRSHILIHAGNKINDTKGCILVGKQFNNGDLSHSRLALDLLLKTLPSSTKLVIV